MTIGLAEFQNNLRVEQLVALDADAPFSQPID